MKKIFLVLLAGYGATVSAQELFPYTEPASNMPAKSLSVKLSSLFEKAVHSNRLLQRYTPELMLGLNKAWMVHAALSVSDMHEQKFILESARLYAKWRFVSVDDVHKHFRMAAFGTAAYSRNHLDHNEINLMGDQSGIQAGLIATQLLNKVALSASASWNEVVHQLRGKKIYPQQYAFTAFNYSLSAGYLLFPLEYTSFDQTNVNLYAELLGSRNIAWSEKYYVDMAPSVQFIFKSTSKLNIGYRFQLAGDIYRLAKGSFMVSYEYLFLDALRKKMK